MPVALLLAFLPLSPAHADTPHPAALHIDAPEDLAVFNDWSRPIDVLGGFTTSANYAAWQCQWWVDGALLYEGAFSGDGRCDTTLDLSRRAPGHHKFAMKAVRINDPALLQATANALFNGAPEVTASVAGTCVEDTAESTYEIDVIIDDVVWEARHWATLYRAESITVKGALFGEDGTTPTGAESSTTVLTNDLGHAEAHLSIAPPGDVEGPFTWLVTVTDPQGAATPFPADGVAAGYLALDAPPVPTWYETLPGAENDAVEAVSWSNDVDHSPYLLLVTLEDGDDGIAADIETVLLTATTSGGTDHQYDCSDAYGTSYYCDQGADGWLLSLPTAELDLDTYNVTLLTADECTTTDPLILTIAAEDDVDNDRDGVAENGVGPDHDCDDEDPDNAAGADAAEAFGNETDVDAEAMSGDPSTGFSAEGNLHNGGDVDWWAFEVSGDGTDERSNASFTLELTIPADGMTPYGAWNIAVETNIDGATTPDSDPSRIGDLDIGAVSEDCGAGSTCVFTVEVAGRTGTPNELYWWLGISASTWSPAMCDDAGAAYTLQVRE